MTAYLQWLLGNLQAPPICLILDQYGVYDIAKIHRVPRPLNIELVFIPK
jgi:hypothetical protein